MAPEYDLKIAEQISQAVGEDTMRTVSDLTNHNTESVRRYIKGESKIPASFVGQIAKNYRQDANTLLCIPFDHTLIDLRLFPTDRLIDELGRRMKMIENCAIASVVVQQDKIC